MAITFPGDIDSIFDKPGEDWTVEERVKVVVWLNSEPQRSYLVRFAKRQLGCSAKIEDGEDAWHEFCVKQLNLVINSYDQAKGKRFWRYLLYCFGRFCRAQPRRLRPPRPNHVVVEGEPVEFELVDPNKNVEREVEQKEMLHHLLNCLNKLPERDRYIVYSLCFEEKSVEETARQLGISNNHVRVLLYRARRELKQCLRRFRGDLPS